MLTEVPLSVAYISPSSGVLRLALATAGADPANEGSRAGARTRSTCTVTLAAWQQRCVVAHHYRAGCNLCVSWPVSSRRLYKRSCKLKQINSRGDCVHFASSYVLCPSFQGTGTAPERACKHVRVACRQVWSSEAVEAILMWAQLSCGLPPNTHGSLCSPVRCMDAPTHLKICSRCIN